ncbi:MAG: pitrilysin family protein [Pseudomonadota bacterium]
MNEPGAPAAAQSQDAAKSQNPAQRQDPAKSQGAVETSDAVNVTSLSNGVRVVSDRMPGLASAALGVWVGAGARHERAEQNGVAHFLEHMAFKGTSRRSAQDIAEEIEDVGGELNAYTSRDTTAYYARVLADDADCALDILADILRDPLFDPDDVDLERGVILQEIGQCLDTPDDIVFDWAQEAAFPDQPMGRAILGPPENVSGFDAAALSGFMAERYGPDQLVVGAAGAVDHDALVRFAEARFGDLSPVASAAPSPARYAGGERREIKDLEQAHMILGLPAPGLDDDDVFAAQVHATVLGGGMSSRLFQEAREKRGLCYSIFAQSSHYAETGLLTIYGGCGGSSVAALMEVCATELLAVRDAPGQAELDRAKAQLRAGVLMALESPSSRAERAARNLLSYGRVRPLEEVLDNLAAVSLDDLRAYADRALTGAKPTVTLYGPVADAPAYPLFCERFAP